MYRLATRPTIAFGMSGIAVTTNLFRRDIIGYSNE
jgi:hypothetical protein